MNLLSKVLNLVEAWNLDIAYLNPHVFAPMLEESLNKNFNAQNIFLFLKFYTMHFESRFWEYRLNPESADLTNPKTL